MKIVTLYPVYGSIDPPQAFVGVEPILRHDDGVGEKNIGNNIGTKDSVYVIRLLKITRNAREEIIITGLFGKRGKKELTILHT